MGDARLLCPAQRDTLRIGDRRSSVRAAEQALPNSRARAGGPANQRSPRAFGKPETAQFHWLTARLHLRDRCIHFGEEPRMGAAAEADR